MGIKESALSAMTEMSQADFVRAVTSAGASRKIALSDLVPVLATLLSGKWININTAKVNLDTTASAGTTDGDLYTAITALGWLSDVIE